MGLSQINTAQSSPPKTMAIEKEIEAASDPEVEAEASTEVEAKSESAPSEEVKPASSEGEATEAVVEVTEVAAEAEEVAVEAEAEAEPVAEPEPEPEEEAPQAEEEEPEEEEEEDLVDPHDSAKGVCASKPECMSLKDKLNECNTRVEGKSRTSETCVEEIIDWMHCVDECAAKGLFAKLK